MSRRIVLLLPGLACALALALVAAWLLSRDESAHRARASVNIAAALSDTSVAGFRRADSARDFEFPADHFAHDGFKTEWWYFTGNLSAENGRRFGYQLTFFRSALIAEPRERASDFAATQAWMAHFTLSDIAGEAFHSFERFSRESVGLAGSDRVAGSVWLRDWRCDFSPQGLPLRLRARSGEFAIDVALDSGKPAVLQGDRGLSQKSSGVGNASYYYSLTRLATQGVVRIGAAEYPVRGSSWMDREWMSCSLGKDQQGWDWFALQLDDGSELMWYQLRRKDGAPDPFRAGTLVSADGATRALRAGELELTHDATWQSPRSQAVYPARWRLRAPLLDLDLEVQPLLADQELDVDFRYWEGAVEVRGSRAGVAVQGRGYVELVGYGKQRPGEFTR